MVLYFQCGVLSSDPAAAVGSPEIELLLEKRKTRQRKALLLQNRPTHGEV